MIKGGRFILAVTIFALFSFVSVHGVYGYTDDNTNETLIISTDKKVYAGLTQAVVRVNVTNIGSEKRFVDLSTYHTDLSGVDVKELYVLEDIPITVPDYKLVTEEVPSDTNSGYTNYTYYEQVGSHVEYAMHRSRLTDNDTFINAMKAKQGIPAKYADRESKQEKKAPSTDNKGKKLAKKARLYDLSLNPGETKKFMMLITFSINSSGEFFIETYDANTGESLGLLDPWWDSNWHYKIPLQVTNDNYEIINATVLYSADIAEELSNLSTANETFDLNSIRIVEVNDSGTIIKEVLVDTELANLSGWWRFNEGNGTVAHDSSSKGNDGTHYGNTRLLMHFDEGNGTTATDESLYGNDGTVYNANWTSAGKSGNALEFDGVDDYVDLGSGSSLDITGTEMTMCAWIKPRDMSADGGATRRIILGDNDNGYSLGFYETTDKFSVSFYNSTTGAAAEYVQIEDEQWHYLCGVYEDGVGVRIYFDGDLKETDSLLSGNLRGIVDSVKIGKDDGDRPFNGTIDEVAIYSRALTAAEIQDLYNAGKAEFTDWTSGKYGNALSFDGVDDYVELALDDFQFGTTSFSWGMWFKTNSTSRMFLIGQNIANNDGWEVDLETNNKLYFYICDAGVCDAAFSDSTIS